MLWEVIGDHVGRAAPVRRSAALKVTGMMTSPQRRNAPGVAHVARGLVVPPTAAALLKDARLHSVEHKLVELDCVYCAEKGRRLCNKGLQIESTGKVARTRTHDGSGFP